MNTEQSIHMSLYSIVHLQVIIIIRFI